MTSKIKNTLPNNNATFIAILVILTLLLPPLFFLHRIQIYDRCEHNGGTVHVVQGFFFDERICIKNK